MEVYEIKHDGYLLGFIQSDMDDNEIEDLIDKNNAKEDYNFGINELINLIEITGHYAEKYFPVTIEL